MASLILSALALLIGVGGYAATEGMASWGKDVRSRLTKLANQIYTKMAQNQQFLDKLSQAYQEKNSSLVNSLFTQAGFGPATIALRKEIKANREKYQKEKQDRDTEQAKLTNQYNEVNQGINNTGSTIAGNASGDQIASKIEKQLGQSIEGGLKNA